MQPQNLMDRLSAGQAVQRQPQAMSGLLPSDRHSQPQPLSQPDRHAQQQPPQKKVKKVKQEEELNEGHALATVAPSPARNAPQRSDSMLVDASASKRPRVAAPPGIPVKREGYERHDRAVKHSSVNGIAWVLSEVRAQLESIMDADGVRQQLEQFPECVLLGCIAARRELVSALLGEQAHANSAAAALVAPGMRQPLAIELRCTPNAKTKGLDLSSFKGPEADAWLASVSQAASGALGSRLKVDSLRLRLSGVGFANLDVVDLPEKGVPGAPILPKVEEMRIRHLGNTSNLIVCLEAGPPLELARRFDPSLKRTVLIGAAAVAMNGAREGMLPPEVQCGPVAARALEDRFMKMCIERAPKWITGLEQLEVRMTKSMRGAQEVAHGESGSALLSRARAAGLSFGRALQHVVGGTPNVTTGALALEDELLEFAAAAASSTCGIGQSLTGKEAAAAAEELWSSFGGIEGYIAYLRDNVGISSADVPLNGGAAWHRLMEEIEVAMRLVHPSAKDLKELAICAVQCGGTGLHGHQRWDDVAAKLLLEIAYEPLRRRIRYVAARVNWALQQQKNSVAEWMESVQQGPASRLHSPLFGQNLRVLVSSPIARDLVFNAFDKAAANVSTTLLKNLEGTLSAACLNPKIMLRPSTMVDMQVPASTTSTDDKRPTKEQVRARVKEEMKRRSGPSGGGVPVGLRDRTFEPSEAQKALPSLEKSLCRAFKTLANTLANQAFAFADTSLSALCRRNVDEAMNAIEFSPEQQRALDAREAELQATATQERERVDKVRKCLVSLKSMKSN